MTTRTVLACLLFVCAGASAVQAQTTPRGIVDLFGIRFEPNVGQASSDADFIAHGPEFSLSLTPSGAIVRGSGHTDVRLVFDGGSEVSRPVGEAQAPGVVNYLLGNDPSRWYTGIGTFERVRYAAVYPGIDVVYHASVGQMEYDFVVEAGADPRRIRMRFEGADDVSIERSGDLAIRVGGRILLARKPVLYQGTAGERRLVDGAFVRFDDGAIGFEVDEYDTRAPLVIDPVLVYSTYLPQRADSSIEPHLPAAVAVGGDGAMYIVGTIRARFGGIPQDDIFVAKINPPGSSLAFITYLGGTSSEVAQAVALGPSDEIYLAGETPSYDFPSVAAAQGTYAGEGDAFLAKLSSSGDTLQYATVAGGSDTDFGKALAVDAEGNAYLVGTTESLDFPLLFSPNSVQFRDGFVAKYDPFGALLFSIVIGGDGFDEARAVQLAPDGALIVAGEASSTNFPVTPGAFMTVRSGVDGFVARLRAIDGQVLAATLLGGSSFDEVRGVSTDASGAVYVTGETFSQDFPTTDGVVQPTYTGIVGWTNGFVTKLTPSLSALGYSTFIGGGEVDSASWIDVDADGQAVVAGPTRSEDFPQFRPLYPLTTAFALPSFISKLSSTGSQFVYSSFWPATITAMTLGPDDDAYVAGTAIGTLSGVYPTTANALHAPASVDFLSRGVVARISDASPVCSYETSPSVFVVSSESSTYSLSVVAPSECFWTVTSSDAGWLVPTTPSGFGTGTAHYAVADLAGAPRSATLTIGSTTTSETVTVYQRECFITAGSPAVQPAGGASLIVNVSGSPGCHYTTLTDAPWITVTPAFDVLDAFGKGQVTLTVAPNTSIEARNAFVFIGTTARSGGVPITQAGRCTTSLTSPPFEPQRTGGTVSMHVTVAPEDCHWTAESNVPWLVPSVPAGVGSQTVTVTAAPAFSTRVGRLMIAGQSLSVLQRGPSFSSTPMIYPPSPAAGSGLTQTFEFTFYNANGASTLDVVNVLVNDFLDGGSACYLAYVPSINVLYLVNDPGNALLPGLILDGRPETLGNSQCAIDGAASSAALNDDVLTLALKVTFSPAFAGNKVVYQAARTNAGFNSGWIQQGVWSVPADTAPPLEVVSMTPPRNAGSAYPFRFTFRSAAGADRLISTTVLVNGYLDGFRACYLGYHVPTNSILLLNDAGDAYLATVALGTNATIENSQCRIKAQESWAEMNGADLDLMLMIEFKAGFAGDRVFYLSAQDDAGTSGWQAVGTWTVH